MLAIEDQDSEWVKDWLKMLSMGFLAINEENPFERGAIPVVLGEGEHRFLILDPRTIREDGEMDFVKYTLAEVQARFKDFTSYLLHDLEVERQLLEKEKTGVPDEEDEEEG